MQFFNSPFGSQTVLKFVAQSASDTVEEEGFAYLTGGVLTALIPASGVVKLARGGSKIKAPGKSKVNDSPYSKEFLQGKIDAAKAGIADVRVPVFTKEKLSTGSSEINSFGMEMKSLGEVRLQLFKGKSGSTDLVNAPVPKKPSGGSNPKDFVNPHSEKHLYDRSRPSTPNRSQYGEDVDVAKLRQETMTSPDKAYSNWPNPNNPNPNKITKYYKEFDGNISTPDTPTGSHRVFENLDNPTRSSHFPYVPRK